MKTLNCSRCGAPIEIRGSVLTVKCPYCGTTQAIPQEVLQEWGSGVPVVCPVCGQNDRLARVSALVTQGYLGKDPELALRLTLQEPEYFDLTPPQLETIEIPPLSHAEASVLFGGTLFVLSLLFTWSFARSEDALVSFGCGSLSCLVGIVSFFSLLNLPEALRTEAARWRARRLQRQALAEYRRQYARYQREYPTRLQANGRMKQEHQERLKLWEELYYCFRDDCICLPESGQYAPASQMLAFLDAQRKRGEGNG